MSADTVIFAWRSTYTTPVQRAIVPFPNFLILHLALVRILPASAIDATLAELFFFQKHLD
jgi:hypothetical protein